jgi:hypothetical protein
MLKKPILYILLCSIFSLTSCLDVIEDISINEQKGGKYKLIVNLSESKTQIDKIRTQDSILTFKVPTTDVVTKKIEQVKTDLLSVNGISNVTYKTDFTNYIFELSFEFSSIEQLNQSIVTIWKAYDKNAPKEFPLYSFENNVFKRNTNISPLDHIINKIGSNEIEFLQKSDYTVILRFFKPIDSYSSNHYQLSASKKAVMYKKDIWTTISTKSFSANNIQLTK